MKLISHDGDSFAQAELKTFNLNDYHIDNEVALNEIRRDIESEFSELNSSSVMKSRCDYFAIPDTSAADYKESLLDLGKGRKVIYGVRHMGGDRETPFIQIKPNFKLENSKEALEIYELVKNDFVIFKPKYLSFWSAYKIDADFFGSTYLITTAIETRDLKPRHEEERIELIRITDDSYYNWYKEGYEIFHKKNPSLKHRVTVNSIESMQDSKEQGLLYEVLIKDEKVGLIAGERSDFLGHQGIYFLEIFIKEYWQGRGLAKTIQRSFINLNAKPEDFIWGTVDMSNLSSYKTAISNGRRPVRFECFLNLTEV